eukprot:1015357-Pleurochrysis_carterae.AAC.2
MVFTIVATNTTYKHSCESDASDWVAGDIPLISLSAYTAVNACPLSVTHLRGFKGLFMYHHGANILKEITL